MFIKTKYTGKNNITPNFPYYVEETYKGRGEGCHIISDTGNRLYVLLGMSRCAHLGKGYEWEVCVTGTKGVKESNE